MTIVVDLGIRWYSGAQHDQVYWTRLGVPRPIGIMSLGSIPVSERRDCIRDPLNDLIY